MSNMNSELGLLGYLSGTCFMNLELILELI